MARSPSGYEETEGEVLTPFYNSIKTKTAELKHSVKPWCKNGSGEVVSRRDDKERIVNYAAALQLVSQKTTIPVPPLFGFGENDDGTAWIEMERTHGGIWLPLVIDQCRMSAGKEHVVEGECAECDRITKTNARRFLAGEVLPQLRSLTSDTTGLNGVVIPPLWVMEWERDAVWPPKTAASGREEYVFCHGNLHAHSILMHAGTLHVLKIVDWEDAGYFPPEFLNVWSLERPGYEE
jgi:hypothetical protein